MLQTLSRHTKLIAWFFAVALYIELILLPVSGTAQTSSHSFVRAVSKPTLIDNKQPERLITGYLPVVTGNSAVTMQPNRPFTGGPTQPETQSYQSVNANNMVDLFTGDFSYNIPLLDVGGYPVNLHYQSGITMEQEASWVGLGWNINPGAISRNMRGLPDDFNGEDLITKTLSLKPNKTVGVSLGFNVELLGKTIKQIYENQADTVGKSDTTRGRHSFGLSLGLFHNTYKGYGTEIGLNAGINAGAAARGPLSGGLSLTNNSQDGFQVSSSLSYHIGKNNLFDQGALTLGTSYNARTGIHSLQLTGEMRRQRNLSAQQRYSSGFKIGPALTFARPSYTPTITIPITSTNITFTAKAGTENWALHPSGNITGYGTNQFVDEKNMSLPAYGYLYYDKAKNSQSVLLDFNREKDISFHESTPHVAIPFYTYDTYSITGEGNGGLFRPYRSEIGYIFDHLMNTKSKTDRISLDVGFGSFVHAGVDYNKVDAVTKNSPWVADNRIRDIIGFKERDTLFENVYFKNPGEKTSVNREFLEMIGDDKLVRVDLAPQNRQVNTPNVYASRTLSVFRNGRLVDKKTLPSNPVHTVRDKRTQMISYLNADEASKVGIAPIIKSYRINSFPSSSCDTNYDKIQRFDGIHRKKHHISEITVLNPDGRRYIYGTPTYNISQVDVTMSTHKGDNNLGLVGYTPGVENSVNNDRGKEGYFNKEQMPAYAHTFLLSGILSSDYVDITGDGITDDDHGDAIKFNYTRVHTASNPYIWRAPYYENKASYSEGLKTDSRDDRGSYSYGSKEIWYLNSIESKTMIATFVLETNSGRKDANSAKGENGGRDTTQKLYRLRQINLYTRADFLKKGSNAKPIKSVHFEYSYELCRNNPSSVGDSGKLTLKKVWFTYNNNNKGQRNPYEFTYHSSNPNFNSRSMDRWGNYKNQSLNPGGTGGQLTNAEYPYTLQPGTNDWDSTKAADSIAAWHLSEIKLPSGGKIKVRYESDDYAYVQNKRAMQFFRITGFGESPGATVQDSLYYSGGDKKDYHYVFVRVTETVLDKADITRKYLEGVSKLFLKIFVKVPDDKAGWGKGYEAIPVYADIEDYGVRTGTGGQVIWIKMGAITGNESAPATTAIQFLRLNLPSKAYPWSEPGDNFSLRAVLGMLGTFVDNLQNTFKGFSKAARDRNWCNHVDSAKSFARLNNPIYKKLGGGLRVKRIEVHDNWTNMSGQDSSVYGQEYDYSTLLNINGMPTRISSGVATYEPAIGNDENPFRVPHKVYPVKIAALAPTDYMYTEEPFAETLFPAPMVGYSEVKVRTIHRNRKSADGFQQTEFYTAKEFPVIVEFTPFDPESKKSYSAPIANFLRFDARNYVTLSQGFKIELNDMHGKLKSQASYSQNDSITPISYTFNYYRLQDDFAGQKRLSNTVMVADSANGKIDTAEIGKEVEIMVDVREQTSTTISGSVEANIDIVNAAPTIGLGSNIPLPSKETNRYRAIAVLKIVNRYGILDSVIHLEKGSKVSTRSMVYDGETGEVLLSRTNNLFDDPIYNFSYPAHWAYSGMGPAYVNQGAVFRNLLIKMGIMYYRKGIDTVPVKRFFESGDELLIEAHDLRLHNTNDTCSSDFYSFWPYGPTTPRKIWAIDAGHGSEGHQGIIFIDKDGKPYNGLIETGKIIRSGRRNMQAIQIGSITSTKSPIKEINGTLRLHIDSTTGVIAAAAAQFNDFWKVDSTLYKKDTVMILPTLAHYDSMEIRINDAYTLEFKGKPGKQAFIDTKNAKFLEASSWDLGTQHNTQSETKTWFKFDVSSHSDIKPGIVVDHANLHLFGHSERPQLNERYSINQPQASNASYIQRTKGLWIDDGLRTGNLFERLTARLEYFTKKGRGEVETNTRVTVSETPRFVDATRWDTIPVGPMVQNMFNDYLSSNKNYQPALMIELVDKTGETGNNLWSRMTYSSAIGRPDGCIVDGEGYTCPRLKVWYYKTCANGDTPIYSATPTPGYYCYDEPVDTFVCRPNIDSVFNPYRWGVLGNWRMDRAYTYYARRVESDPQVETNIRTDGEIKSFKPYWSFADKYLTKESDTTRWVWNSEKTLFNSKGLEIENHDPLDRYNSGHYGYNRSFPVAVAQNSKNRNMVFDGFEDYDYATDTCKLCPIPRFINLINGGSRVDTISHSGLFSLRIPGNTTGTTAVKVTTTGEDLVTPAISIRIDSTAIVRTEVKGQGNGLKVEYKVDRAFLNFCPGIDLDTWYTLPYSTNVDLDAGNKPLGEGPKPLPGICARENVFVNWSGKIQPRFSEVYTFLGECDDRMNIFVNGRRISESTELEKNHDWNKVIPTDTISLLAGHLYDIRIEYKEDLGNAKARLYWTSASQTMEIVPVENLYLPTMIAADSVGSVLSDTTWCARPRAPRPQRVMLDRFSPIQNTKIVVSAWVKEDAPCINGAYTNSSIELQFNSGGTFDLRPRGPVIEGWQRIEDTLTIPATADSLNIRLRSLSSTPVFFDDLRIHPYNSNMKSFVYNPFNIRLMAELDENNYATFFEYDDDGTLIRVKKETERGIKTIREARSALFKK